MVAEGEVAYMGGRDSCLLNAIRDRFDAVGIPAGMHNKIPFP